MERKHKRSSRIDCPAPQQQLTLQSAFERELPNNVQQAQTTSSSRSSTKSSLPAASSATLQSWGSSSFAEPSLRFPRPKVDRRLANWITSSDPNIMRMTTVPGDDNSLAGSTYELITGTDDDTWSQDGRDHDQDLTSESVSSLDANRTDDVHSLADTEQMSDDEFAQVEDPDATPSNSRYQANPSVDADSQGSVSHHYHDDDADADSEDDAESRSSLEYAQESLKTPSIPTPEASNILEKHTHEGSSPMLANSKKAQHSVYGAVRESFARWLNTIALRRPGFRDVREFTRVALPWFVFFVGVCLIPQMISQVPSQDVAPPTTTVYVTTTSTHTAPLLISPTMSTDQSLPHAPKHDDGYSDSVAVQSSRSTDWIFGTKKPEVTFSTPSSTKLVAHIPQDVKDHWLSEECIEVVSTREGRNIAMTVMPVKEGLVVRFPRSEAYGIVDVTFRASCKPTLHRVLKVHFGKGILEEVYEMTKHIAQDLTEFVPVAAQEAERQLDNAKRSWVYVAESVGTTALSVGGTMSKGLSTWRNSSRQYLRKAEMEMVKATTSLSTLVTTVRDEATEYCDELSNVRLRAQYALKLEILNTQIAAKIWWFKATGREEQAADYRRKAKDFMLAKRRAVEAATGKEAEDCGGDHFLHNLGAFIRGRGSQP